MISRESFANLKPGDIVLFNGKPRVVRDLTKGGRSRMSITFAIMRRSWTGRARTVYDYNDVKHKLSLPRKERNIRDVCAIEESNLLASGFDPLYQAERELREDGELKERCGSGHSRSGTALLKQTIRKFRRRKPKDKSVASE